MDLAEELRELRKELNEVRSRQARTILDGKVAEVRDNMVRLELLEEDPHTGKPFLSPWVRVQEEAGDGLEGYSSYTQRRVGQNMKLISPNGEIGQNSLAVDSGHNDENPTPGQGNKKVMKRGNASITLSTDRMEIRVGDKRIVITPDEIVTHGKTRLNNGTKKVGRVGDVDTMGHAMAQGADEVFS